MAGKKRKEDEIVDGEFEELSIDDIPGATVDPLDDEELGGVGGGGGAARRKAMMKKKGASGLGASVRKKKGMGAGAGGRKKKMGAKLAAAGGGGGGLGPGAAMRRKKKAGARAGGPAPEGRSETFDDAVTGGREVLKQMIQRIAPEDGGGDQKRKGMAQALRRVARGYRELEDEVARLEAELAGKS